MTLNDAKEMLSVEIAHNLKYVHLPDLQILDVVSGIELNIAEKLLKIIWWKKKHWL